MTISKLAFYPQKNYHKAMRFIGQLVSVTLSFGLIYLWQQTLLSSYTIFVLGVIVVIYFALIALKKIPNVLYGSQTSLQIFIINTLIILLVFSTGGLNSVLFFLLYFLAFGVAFVLNPLAMLLFAVGLIAIFLPDILAGDVTGNFIRVGSVAIVSPIAYFLSREFKEKDQSISKSIETIQSETEHILSTKEKLSAKQRENLEALAHDTEKLKNL